MVRNFEHYTPKVAATAYVDETALIIGQVEIDDDSSVWPHAVLRGDIHRIRIGKRTSIQDGTIIHVTHDGPYHRGGFMTAVGDDVTVGHGVILHGCMIENHSLIGMGAIVLDGAKIESYVILGAGSLVPPGKILESGYLWLGSPVKRARKITDEERKQIDYGIEYYVKLKNRHLANKNT